VHLLAVDAAALLPDDEQALALGIRLAQILAHVLERVAKPRFLVQPVVAKFGRGGGQRERKCGNRGGQIVYHDVSFLSPAR